MFCICNERFVFNKIEYYLPKHYSMNYKRYSVENNKFINEITNEFIQEIIDNLSENIIYDNYFEYSKQKKENEIESKTEKETEEERKDKEEYVFYSFINLGNYLNSLGIV
jgi:hypothetical protein